MNVKLSSAQKIKLLNSEAIYSVMKQVLLRENKIGRNKEHFWIIGLAQNNKILYIELISLGTVNATLVEPMEVFSIALQKRSVQIILVHNHPRGELAPSKSDEQLTDRLLQIGKFLNMPVIDHLIISEEGYYSFSDSGLLDELSESKKYVLPYEEVEQIKREGEEEGRNKQKAEMLKALTERGVDKKIISAVTGVSEVKIKQLKKSKSTKKK